MKDLEKLLMKKADKQELSKPAIQAKMDVLKELFELSQKLLGEKVKGGMDEMKKVTVMAPDKEGLKEGLDKAKEIADSPLVDMLSENEEEETPKEESEECADTLVDENKEESSMSEEEPKEDSDEEESFLNLKRKLNK